MRPSIHGSHEYKGAPREAARSTPRPGYFLQDAWARGIVIGVIVSPDHGGGYGKACVFSPELTRQAILASLRARRYYYVRVVQQDQEIPWSSPVWFGADSGATLRTLSAPFTPAARTLC